MFRSFDDWMERIGQTRRLLVATAIVLFGSSLGAAIGLAIHRILS